MMATLMLVAAAASSASAATLASPQPVAFALSPVTATGALRLRGAPSSPAVLTRALCDPDPLALGTK